MSVFKRLAVLFSVLFVVLVSLLLVLATFLFTTVTLGDVESFSLPEAGQLPDGLEGAGSESGGAPPATSGDGDTLWGSVTLGRYPWLLVSPLLYILALGAILLRSHLRARVRLHEDGTRK